MAECECQVEGLPQSSKSGRGSLWGRGEEGSHRPSSSPAPGVPNGEITDPHQRSLQTPAGPRGPRWGALSRASPLQFFLQVPAPGRPYLAARPRAAVAATEWEAQGRRAAWPWPGTRSVAATVTASALCLPGGRAGAAARERGSDERRRRQRDSQGPPGRTPLTLPDPPAPAIVPPRGWSGRTRHAPGFATPPWALPRNHS